jgi:hypothetical protein
VTVTNSGTIYGSTLAKSPALTLPMCMVFSKTMPTL